MPRIAHQVRSRIPPGKWRVILDAARITGSARIFAVCVLAPLMARSGRIRPTRQPELIARYASERGRPSYTPRRVLQLLAELTRAGVLTRDGRPAPGLPVYRALFPGTDLPRPMLVRPRGIAPRRIHAQFVRELAETEQDRGP